MTVAQLLAVASAYVRASSGTLDVEVLLAFVLKKDRAYLVAHLEKGLTVSQKRRFDALFARLLKGEPVAYLIKKKEFYGIEFFVNKHVLIPRPETELLVEKTLKYIEGTFGADKAHRLNPTATENASIQKNHRFKVLDVGTGSGCIAIALAKTTPILNVVGVDISKNALRVAQKNAKKHGVGDRVDFLHGDLLANAPRIDMVNGVKQPVGFSENMSNFDLIVANLPYIGKKRYNFISDTVFKYEPHIALFGGENGLALYEKLFQQLENLAVKPKAFLGEFGFLQRPELEILIKKYFPATVLYKTTFFQDYAGIDRVFMIEFQHDRQIAKNGSRVY